MKIQRSIEIKAPSEKIWPFLIEPDKILRWYNLFQKFEFSSEKHSGVETTFYYEEKPGNRLIEVNYAVTEWVENKRLAFSMISGDPLKYDQVWSIEATSSVSKFIMFKDVEMTVGIVWKIFGVLFGFIMKPVGEFFIRKSWGGNMDKMLANLKSLAEA